MYGKMYNFVNLLRELIQNGSFTVFSCAAEKQKKTKIKHTAAFKFRKTSDENSENFFGLHKNSGSFFQSRHVFALGLASYKLRIYYVLF